MGGTRRIGGNRNKKAGGKYKINKRNEYGQYREWGEIVPVGGTRRRVGGTRRRTGGRRRGRPCKRRRCPPCPHR